MLSTRFSPNDRMCDIISQEFHLLQMMCRFGIPLGVGEKTVSEVCEAAGVPTPTFLAVANFMSNGTADSIKDVSVKALVDYLSRSHDYFLNFRLPHIRRKLEKATEDCPHDVAYIICKFFDDYALEVDKHMSYEEQVVFPYVRALLAGEASEKYNIRIFRKKHDQVEMKIAELKNILIKYYPGQGSHLLNSVLFDIFATEEDLASHTRVENLLFVPAVLQLEANQ